MTCFLLPRILPFSKNILATAQRWNLKALYMSAMTNNDMCWILTNKRYVDVWPQHCHYNKFIVFINHKINVFTQEKPDNRPTVKSVHLIYTWTAKTILSTRHFRSSFKYAKTFIFLPTDWSSGWVHNPPRSAGDHFNWSCSGTLASHNNHSHHV